MRKKDLNKSLPNWEGSKGDRRRSPLLLLLERMILYIKKFLILIFGFDFTPSKVSTEGGTSKNRCFVFASDWNALPDLCDGGASVATAIAAGVSALANVGSGVAMVSKKRGTTRMMEVSKQLADYNNALARENWNLENAYNSPAAQMARFREAGLNPNLIYSQMSNGSGSIQTPTASGSDAAALTSGEADLAKGLDKIAGAAAVYQDIMQRHAQINNTTASTQAVLTEAELNRQRVENQKIINKYQDNTLAYQQEGLILNNSQKALDLEIDRQFKARLAIGQLNEQRERVSNMSMDTNKKAHEINRIDTDIKSLEQGIVESQARTKSLEAGISIGYGNMRANQTNASANMMNAQTNQADMNWQHQYKENLQNWNEHTFDVEQRMKGLGMILQNAIPHGSFTSAQSWNSTFHGNKYAERIGNAVSGFLNYRR